MKGKPSLQELLASIPCGRLDQKISDDVHLRMIANRMTNWQSLRPYLSLSEADEEAVLNDCRTMDTQRMAVLQRWRERLGPHATYRKLATAFYEVDNVTMAEEVCRVLCSRTDLPTQGTNMRVGSQLRKVMVPALYIAVLVAVIASCTPFLWILFGQQSTDLERFSRHKSGSIAANNLPHIPGPFVGRDSDVDRITHLLIHSRSTNIKTVGIYGPPAMGKSTLAIHVGYEMAQLGTEVRYIDMNDVHHPYKDTSAYKVRVHTSSPSSNLVSSTEVMTRTGDARIQLSMYSREEQEYKSLFPHDLVKWAKSVENDTLLILDNCDDLLEIREFKEMIKAINEASEALVIIITSRQRVALTVGFTPYILRELDSDHAMQLFLLLQPTLVNHADAEMVADLVGNNPLALRIVASLDETLPLGSIVQQLRDAPIETLSPDTLPESEQMLHVLQMSYKYLDVSSKACGNYLILFPGSFSEDAAIAIVSMCNSRYDGFQCFDLNGLVKMSLLNKYWYAGQPRYQFHTLIKKFFAYILHQQSETNQSEIIHIFQYSFRWYFRDLLFNFSSNYTRKPNTKTIIGRLEYEKHNFKEMINIVGTDVTCRQINSDILDVVFTKTELINKIVDPSISYCSTSPEEFMMCHERACWLMNLISGDENVMKTADCVRLCKALLRKEDEPYCLKACVNNCDSIIITILI